MLVMVHGDDFITVANREDAHWFRQRLEDRFEIKTKVNGDGEHESKEETVLNLIIRRTQDGWE